VGIAGREEKTRRSAVKNVLIAVLALCAAVLAVWTIRQQSEIARLRDDIVGKTAADTAAVSHRQEASPPAPGDAPARRAVETAREPRADRAAPRAAVEPPPAADGEEKGFGAMMAGFGSMMTNSAMKEMMRAQSKVQLDAQYDRLFKFFNQPEAVIDGVKELLLDRQMALMSAGLAFMSGDVSADERKRKADELKTVKESFDKKIEDLLGTADYDAFKQYEATQQERTQVEMFKHSIASSAEPLTDQQEYDLVNAMYQIRTNAPLSALSRNDDTPPDPADFSAEKVEEMLKQLDGMRGQYATTAQKYLSPAQSAEFQKFLQQQKQMNEMGLRMAAQMFGAGKAKPPATFDTRIGP
jgi:hypothetical protein